MNVGFGLNQILDDPIGVLVDRQVQWRESLLSQASSFVRLRKVKITTACGKGSTTTHLHCLIHVSLSEYEHLKHALIVVLRRKVHRGPEVGLRRSIAIP